jgi:hypothetical protein
MPVSSKSQPERSSARGDSPEHPPGGAKGLKDILQPKALGAAPTPPFVDEAVTSLFERLPAVVSQPDARVREFVSSHVAAALIERNIPSTALCLPRLDVFMPALEAVRYSPVKEAFAALIAYSMDTRGAHMVLPAYVEMLKQISHDELSLLKAFPPPGRFTPSAEIVYALPNGQIISAYRHVLSPAVCKELAHKDNIPQYIDNLLRLSLLYRPVDQEAADTAYRPLTRLAFVRDLMKAAPAKAKAGLEKSVLGLSDLGTSFLRACLI